MVFCLDIWELGEGDGMNTEQAKHEWSDILEAVKISIIGWAKELYQDGIADGMNGGESFEDGFDASYADRFGATYRGQAL
jgi:hypothetical protein